MDRQNIKDIVSARYNNPRFQYDGKRMRYFTSRNVNDYNSYFIVNRHLDLSHYNTLERPVDPLNPPYKTRMAHFAVNKSKNPVFTIKWTPDGRRLITGNSAGEFTLWSGNTFSFDTIMQAHDSAVRSIEWLPRGDFFISGDNSGYIKYWSTCLNNVKSIRGSNDAIRDISFSPSGEKFCTASDNGVVGVFDTIMGTNERNLEGHGWDVTSAQWHNDYSLIVSGAKDNMLKFWDPRISEELYTHHAHKNSILVLRFSQCGNYLLSGGKDQLIKQTDIRMFKNEFIYKTPNREVTSITSHPHIPSLFVSGANDGTIFYWQHFSEDNVKIEGHHENTVWTLEYHPMGHMLSSGSADMSCRFWLREEEQLE